MESTIYNKTLRKFESQFFFKMVEDRKGRFTTFIYNYSNVLEYLGIQNLNEIASKKVVREWADLYNLSIYSAPKESYSEIIASEQSIKNKKSGVIVEKID